MGDFKPNPSGRKRSKIRDAFGRALVDAYVLVASGEENARITALRCPDHGRHRSARGILIERHTGEGKTLSAVMPAYLNALTGEGVHVLTFNDYLAHRDAEWMGPIYRFLGLTVKSVQAGMSLSEKREAYAADITYVTAKEAGFDYLRDTIALDEADTVHRPFHYVIVDEADSRFSTKRGCRWSSPASRDLPAAMAFVSQKWLGGLSKMSITISTSSSGMFI